jgi:hypothetical protein
MASVLVQLAYYFSGTNDHLGLQLGNVMDENLSFLRHRQ